MTSTLRAQAAAAAKKWRYSHRDSQDQLHGIGEAAYAIGYEDGHAAGEAEGARRFAEHMIAKFPRLEARSQPIRDELARFLSSLAPGTPTPEPHCGWAPGHYKNICCICGKAFSDCDKRAVTCLPCADKELAKSSLAPGTGEEPKGG